MNQESTNQTTQTTQTPIVVSSTPVQTVKALSTSDLDTAITQIHEGNVTFNVNGFKLKGKVVDQWRRFPATSGVTFVQVDVAQLYGNKIGKTHVSDIRTYLIHETGQCPVHHTEVIEISGEAAKAEWLKEIQSHNYIQIPASRWA